VFPVRYELKKYVYYLEEILGNKRSAYTEIPIPPSSKWGGTISKYVHVYDRIKLLVMDLHQSKDSNDCAGEALALGGGTRTGRGN
jgi:hypothetical protein